MTLRRMGPSAKDFVANKDTENSAREAIRKQLVVLNDYLALMNNEIDPPDRTEDETE